MSRRGLCDGLITCPEESYRLWSVVVCDQETSNTRRLPGCENTITMGCNARKTNKQSLYIKFNREHLIFTLYGMLKLKSG